jgi:hypothetical protein
MKSVRSTRQTHKEDERALRKVWQIDRCQADLLNLMMGVLLSQALTSLAKCTRKVLV